MSKNQYNNFQPTITTVPTGSNNTGFGNINASFQTNTETAITDGSANTAFGSFALSTNSKGNYNTAVGSGALRLLKGLKNGQIVRFSKKFALKFIEDGQTWLQVC